MLPKIATTSLLIIASIASAHAAQVTIGGCAGPTSGYGQTTCVAGATVDDFNGGTLPAGYTGSGTVESGSTGQWATPAGDTSGYLAVATNSPSGVEDIRFGGSYNYVGLLWGSIDTYNELDAYSNGVEVASITGSQVIAASSLFGNQQAAGSNEYVNILFGTGVDEIKLTTGNYNFEVDNVAHANVPEPASFGLLGLGIAGLMVRRRRC